MGIGKRASLQQAGPEFLGSDIIHSDLDAQFCFKDFVTSIVLGIGELGMIGCVSGC